jgi:hypothetical protein
VPGQQFTVGQRLAEVGQTAIIVQTWDPNQMNATFGEVFGGQRDQTMRDWIRQQVGDWNNPLTRWSGANRGNLIIITENSSTVPAHMATLVHELLHMVTGGGTELASATALRIYTYNPDFSPEVNEGYANQVLNAWLEKCIGDFP